MVTGEAIHHRRRQFDSERSLHRHACARTPLFSIQR